MSKIEKSHDSVSVSPGGCAASSPWSTRRRAACHVLVHDACGRYSAMASWVAWGVPKTMGILVGLAWLVPLKPWFLSWVLSDESLEKKLGFMGFPCFPCFPCFPSMLYYLKKCYDVLELKKAVFNIRSGAFCRSEFYAALSIFHSDSCRCESRRNLKGAAELGARNALGNLSWNEKYFTFALVQTIGILFHKYIHW